MLDARMSGTMNAKLGMTTNNGLWPFPSGTSEGIRSRQHRDFPCHWDELNQGLPPLMLSNE